LRKQEIRTWVFFTEETAGNQGGNSLLEKVLQLFKTLKLGNLLNEMDITLTVYEKEYITNLDLILRCFKGLKEALHTSLKNKGLGKAFQQKFTLEV
jgi:hypothetical protein